MEPAGVREYERPGPLRWLSYVFGRGLPERYHSWVLHDVTCRTWVFRHIFRGLIQVMIPVALVLLFLPAPFWLRGLTAIAAGGPCLLGYLIMIVPMTENRLIKAGYRPAVADEIRSKRAVATQASANWARRERIATRQAERAARRRR